jgi:hypothetical protein
MIVMLLGGLARGILEFRDLGRNSWGMSPLNAARVGKQCSVVCPDHTSGDYLLDRGVRLAFSRGIFQPPSHCQSMLGLTLLRLAPDRGPGHQPHYLLSVALAAVVAGGVQTDRTRSITLSKGAAILALFGYRS